MEKEKHCQCVQNGEVEKNAAALILNLAEAVRSLSVRPDNISTQFKEEYNKTISRLLKKISKLTESVKL